MDSHRFIAARRATLTFCVEGFQAREELLVKSFIRLIDHLTKQQWVYQPLGGQARIDLLLAAPGGSAAFAARYGELPLAVVEVGGDEASPANEGPGKGYLSWPLKPGALEKELNRVGELTASQAGRFDAARADPGLLALQTKAASVPHTTTNTTSATNTTLGHLRLKQWPSAQLLTGPGRMRLATLLTGRGMAMDELVSRSRLPQPLCDTFISELRQAGLLSYTATAHAGAGADVPHAEYSRADRSIAVTDIFDSQFKDATSAPTRVPTRRYDTYSPRLPVGAAAQPSLLARIRLRLGIGT